MLAEWYAPEFDDSAWGTKNTFLTWDRLDPPANAKVYDYDGYNWYRTELEVDKTWTGKPVRLHLGGVCNEGWVWLNGQYVRHKRMTEHARSERTRYP